MSLINTCNKIIEYSFYALFFFVPLVFASNNFELFEFNKMWVTFGLTSIIAASWTIKMILRKKIAIQKTPLDIPILLFLLSQIVSTALSIDTHVSIWGYYSRFNGGLLSTISYILLYYAFVSNYREVTDNNEKSGIFSFFHLTTGLPTKVIRIGFIAMALLAILLGFFISYPRPPASTGTPLILVITFILAFFLFTFAITGKFVKRLLIISLICGAIVTVWGLPSFFGYDPTCLLIRGTFDVSCWTEAFQPKIRIFSTLGQPNWMAAYLSILIPIVLAFGITYIKKRITIALGFLAVCFYVGILFTNSRSGFYGLMTAIVIFIILLIWKIAKNTMLRNITTISGLMFLLFWIAQLAVNKQLIILATITSFLIFALSIVYNFLKTTYQPIKIKQIFLLVIILIATIISLYTRRPYALNLNAIFPPQNSTQQTVNKPQPVKETAPAGPALEFGGTDSSKIRRIVWTGALEIWKHNPLFGSGVETFAYSYYKYRLPEHNLTSEWDYLYNKAHSEILNYLATTGLFGLGSYIFVILLFLWITFRYVLSNTSNLLKSQLKSSALDDESYLFIIALIGSYISIIISNSLGFSVVIVNLYFFIIPAIVLVLGEMINPNTLWAFPKFPNTIHKTLQQNKESKISNLQWILTSITVITSLFIIVKLFIFWHADTEYALGANLDKVGQYQQAYPHLINAVKERPDEPSFRDELSVNEAVLAVAYASSKDINQATKYAEDAIRISNDVITNNPNNVVYWKTRVRIFYSLSQLNPQYLQLALDSMKRVKELAPTDAKISYNLGVLYGQVGNSEKAVEILEQTIKLKSDYTDAYYALGLFYHNLATNGKPQYQQKAVENLEYVLKRNPGNENVKQILASWGVD